MDNEVYTHEYVYQFIHGLHSTVEPLAVKRPPS